MRQGTGAALRVGRVARRVGRWRPAAALLAVLLAAGVPCAPARGGEDAKEEVAAARELLEGGQAAEALEQASRALERAPTDPEVLDLASRAAEAAERRDEALWLAHSARLAAVAAGWKGERLEALAARVEALEPLPPEARAPVDAYARSLLDLGRLCARRRLFVNAVQVLARLEGGLYGPEAEEALERIYRDKKALAALLDSQVDVPPTATDRKVLLQAAKEDAKHTQWGDAWSLDTDNYTVVTNTGYELAHRTTVAMEQVNRFYREVFGLKPRGGAPRCKLELFATQALYQERASPPPEAMAYYSPSEVRVAAYDPRSEGRPLSTLWSTLFHEASHQFVDLVAADDVPAWLNEGTASYFEGARIRADGRVETNLVPRGRLEGLVEVLRSGTPTVREVIEFPGPGSYPGEYYSVGWGLVYFLRNYEDEKLSRPYLPLYEKMLASYRKGGGEPALARFERLFVEEAAQPGVASLEDLEARFRDWVVDLEARELVESQSVGPWLESARRHLAAKQLALAEADFRGALRRMPGHVEALTGFAELLASQGRRDEALALLRRAREAIRRDGIFAAGFSAMQEVEAQEAAERAKERMRKLDAAFADAVDALDRELSAKAAAAAQLYLKAGYPRAALRVVDAAVQLADGDVDLRMLRDSVASEHGVELFLWRSVPVERGLAGWYATPEWEVEGGAVRTACTGARAALLLEDLPSRYRFEATLRPSELGPQCFFGLVFGADPEGTWKVAGLEGDIVALYELGETWKPLATPGGLPPGQVGDVRLAVDVRPGRARVFVDGELYGEQDFPLTALRGGVGLLAVDAKVEFRDLRLGVTTGRYFR